MSELTRCNLCKLKDYRREAKSRGRVLVRRQDSFGPFKQGARFYAVLRGDPPTEDTFVAWLAEIPSRCCC